ncbi:hypothetical protein D3C80_2156350 [compost metagenome]
MPAHDLHRISRYYTGSYTGCQFLDAFWLPPNYADEIADIREYIRLPGEDRNLFAGAF